MSIRVNADLFRIAYACVSTEEARYYLNGVYVEASDGGGALLVSTDGNRLLCIHDPEGEVDKPTIVKLTKEALRLCKSGKGSQRRIVLSTDHLLIEDEETVTKYLAKDCVIDGKFPDWRRAVPATPFASIDGYASFDAKYVLAFARVGDELAKLSDAHKAPMRVLSHNEADPAIVLWPGTPTAFGVLMPIRTDDERTTPPFFAPVANVAEAA